MLGLKGYLNVVSYVFLQSYCWRFNLKAHYQINALQKLVKEGDVCLDIGANLGYFTVPLSRLVGSTGKVYAVEPVSLFRDILQKNVERFAFKNVEIVPYALGDEDEKKVSLGTLKVDGLIHHGMTGILQSSAPNTAVRHEATMMRPTTLFAHLPRMDFVKCDVEGYELHIIPHLLPIFERFFPTLEIEMASEESKTTIAKWMKSLGYDIYFLAPSGRFLPLTDVLQQKKEFEWYFIHPSRK
ncbi:MAG: FkbM family methyltransferase [Flammeovirgaceae bacterium]|nr:FkbM family methyltransferase [Flammeovirgaceae bacterium]